MLILRIVWECQVDGCASVAGYYPYPGGDLELEDNEDDSKDKREIPHEPEAIKCPRYGSVSAQYFLSSYNYLCN